MLIRIFVVMIACILVIFFFFWVATGGISRGISIARSLNNPLDIFRGNATGTTLRLPWQPQAADYGAYSMGDTSTPRTSTEALTATDQGTPDLAPNTDAGIPNMQDLQKQYKELSVQAREARTFGDPSPYRGKIIFDEHDTAASLPTQEYIRLSSGFGNTEPITLVGWSLQSAVTNVRVTIPPAAATFVAGSLNNVSPITLSSGDTVTITSGPSPVGVSFRENVCSGYLGELQTFTPSLDTNCPSPTDELPLTPENIQLYGETCIDYFRSIQQCHFPGRETTTTITPACRNFAINQLSYNGCVYAHRNDADFAQQAWRVYLASSVKLWRATHDVIRLLDDQGRTVDVLTY